MNELGPKARRLLELARHEDDPRVQDRDRVQRVLAARIALGAGPTGVSAAIAKSAAASAGTPAVKVLVTLGFAGALAAGGWFATENGQSASPPGPRTGASASTSVPAQSLVPVPQPKPQLAPPRELAVQPERERSRPEEKSSAERVRPAAPVAAADPGFVAAAPKRTMRNEPPSGRTGEDMERRSYAEDTESEPSDGTESGPADRTVVEPSRPVDDALQVETDALRAAQRVLRSGDAGRALSLLAQQDATFRAGALQQERAAARVFALCQGGDAESARAEAQRFERRWPRSVLLSRVRTACRAGAVPATHGSKGTSP